jgi:cytochrome P450
MMAIAERPAGTRFLRWLNTVPNNGLIRFSGILNSEMLLLASPKAIGEVLVQRAYDFEKPTGVRSLLRVVLGDGLVVTEGDVHKFQRKHIMPSFSFRSIRALYPIFWSKAAELHDVISAEVGADGKVIEINGWANKVTMDVIGLATMGRNFGTMRHAGDELIRDYETILEPTREKTLYFVVHTIFPRWFIRMWPWRLNQLLANTMKSLNGISLQLVKDKKELVRREEKIEGGEDGDELPKGNVDILSSLIRSNDFNEEMLVDQMLTFLAAG